MRLSAIVPVHGPLLAAGGAMRMAVTAEQAGADGVWVGDHIVMLDEATGYPYNETGTYPASTDTPYFESLTLCAMMAAVTELLRVGTAVLVLPQRNVLQLAKTATTIDAISGGRLTLGFGSGWFAGEMEALGYDFATRGRRMDEMLDVLRMSWSGRIEGYRGDQVEVPAGVIMQPTPVDPRGVRILLGGLSRVAIRRAARSDGWIGLGYVARFDMDAMREQLEAVRTERAAAGRGLDDFSLVLKLTCPVERMDELPQRVREASALGYDEIIFDVPWRLGMDAAAATITAVRAENAHG